MTDRDVIRALVWQVCQRLGNHMPVEAFEAMRPDVDAHERGEITTEVLFDRFAARAVAAERERCATKLEDLRAAAIRKSYEAHHPEDEQYWMNAAHHYSCGQFAIRQPEKETQ